MLVLLSKPVGPRSLRMILNKYHPQLITAISFNHVALRSIYILRTDYHYDVMFQTYSLNETIKKKYRLNHMIYWCLQFEKSCLLVGRYKELRPELREVYKAFKQYRKAYKERI